MSTTTFPSSPSGPPTDPAPVDDVPDQPAPPPARRTRSRRGTSRWKLDTHRWARWLHVYTSMIALVIVLFFGATGITLNHPSWTFGDDVDVTTVTGTLPIETTLDDGSVDFLSVSEYLRDTYDISGSVDSFDVTNGEGSIAYKNAGYAADVFFDVDTGEFELTVEQQGWVAVINDLHKGRDTGTVWKWVIDIAAGFLVVISLTGLVMQFFLRKRRISALTTAGIGALVAVVAIVVTLH